MAIRLIDLAMSINVGYFYCNNYSENAREREEIVTIDAFESGHSPKTKNAQERERKVSFSSSLSVINELRLVILIGCLVMCSHASMHPSIYKCICLPVFLCRQSLSLSHSLSLRKKESFIRPPEPLHAHIKSWSHLVSSREHKKKCWSVSN
jgi:hypothetical protein